jgi:hypothetical protein
MEWFQFPGHVENRTISLPETCSSKDLVTGISFNPRKARLLPRDFPNSTAMLPSHSYSLHIQTHQTMTVWQLQPCRGCQLTYSAIERNLH